MQCYYTPFALLFKFRFRVIKRFCSFVAFVLLCVILRQFCIVVGLLQWWYKICAVLLGGFITFLQCCSDVVLDLLKCYLFFVIIAVSLRHCTF